MSRFYQNRHHLVRTLVQTKVLIFFKNGIFQSTLVNKYIICQIKQRVTWDYFVCKYNSEILVPSVQVSLFDTYRQFM